MSADIDAAALIRRGKPRTAEFRLCVEPDLVAEYEAAVAARDKARSGPRESLSDGAVPPGLDERIAALLAQIEENTVVLTFRTLPRPRFRELRDAYPPRTDDDGKPTHAIDAQLGINYDEFWDPFIRASLASPKLDDATMTMVIEELLTEGQWEDLTSRVWNLNESKVNVPFSPAVSPTTPTS